MAEELIIRARNGDTQAWNILIDSHKELAFSIAFKYLKNKEDAEDIAQNAFIIVFKSIHSFRNEAKFSTWLYRIIFNECMREVKKKNQSHLHFSQFTTWEDEIIIPVKEPDINTLLESLSANEYIVVSLFYLKEKSIKEIVEITGLNTANIKVLLHRARQKMKTLTPYKNQ